MSDISTEVLGRLVVKRKQDGRCVYDPQAKAQIVQACLQPGVSVARMGLQCGVNANLLRRWIGERHKEVGLGGPAVVTVERADSAPFVPLRIEAAMTAASHRQVVNVELHARLANGVQVELRPICLDDVARVIEALGGLKCSASTKP